MDFEKGFINVFAGKTQKVRVVLINKPVRRILDFWVLGISLLLEVKIKK